MMFAIKARKWRASTALTRSLKSGSVRVKVGFPASKVDGGVIERAVFNNFGTKGSGKGFKKRAKGGKMGGGFGGPVPERPFMQNAMRDNEAKYKLALTAAAATIVKKLATVPGADLNTLTHEALSKLGIMAQRDIQGEITALSSPPNSPVTIALKGSSNPLIDTGEMRQAVTWAIDE